MLEKLFAGGSQPTPIVIPLTFRMPEEKALRLVPENYDSLTAWRFLSHHIRRYPLDLRAHVQRILLANEEGLQDRLEGSLLDLFLALGSGSGDMLKERMLEQSTGRLSEEALQYFNQWMQDGPKGGMDREWRLGSMLATGESTSPQTLITIERTTEPKAYGSVMEEVQACMEYGQIDLAQGLLEQEILKNGRADEDIERELLNIYQYTRNKVKLNELAEAMAAKDIQVSGEWKELQREADSW